MAVERETIMSMSLLLVAAFVLSSKIWFVNADKCIEEKTYTGTCYQSSSYTTSCGLAGLRRCNRYKSVANSCNKTYNEEVCCAGFTGEDCNTPLCFNSTVCANRGTCVSPDNCKCIEGYSVPACDDIDECGLNLCEDICHNTMGSYMCWCNEGYMIQSDRRSCSDVDECLYKNGGCKQRCVNTDGSFYCSCFEDGYGQSHCTGVCAGEKCQNGGVCFDNLFSFTCICPPGFIGDSCEQDENECSMLNSGCDDYCENKHGSFECYCKGNRTLAWDRRTCEGGDIFNVSVFDRLRIPRKLLPEGCFIFIIGQLKSLISTLPWYCLNDDPSVCYTEGIVYLDTKTRLYPLSIHGVTITNKILQSIKIGTSMYQNFDGLIVEHDTACNATELSIHDFQDFIREGSFLRSFFTLLRRSLPSWMRIAEDKPHTLLVQDMKSEIKIGRQIQNIQWCSEAPVIADRMYNVFRFTTGFTLKIYGETVFIPEVTSGGKFCLLADVSQNSNGTVFILIPESVGKTIVHLTDYFQTFNDLRGIGISIDGAINAETRPLAFWNGYNTFIPSIPNPRLWVGSRTDISLSIIKFKGIGNFFKSASNTETIIASADPYRSISILHVTANPTFHIRTLGETYQGSFDGMVSSDIAIYQNMQDISQCDENHVPDGFFTSIKVTLNPFRNIPILRHWSPYQDETFVIDILNKCQRTEHFPLDFTMYVHKLNQIVADILHVEMEFVPDLDVSRNFYRVLKTFESHTYQYKNSSVYAKDIQFIEILLNEMMKRFHMQRKTASTCTSLGFRFKADISFEVLEKKTKIGFFNVEILYSDKLLQCSRFDSISKLLDDEPSIRIIGQASKSKGIGEFLTLEKGAGLGMVMSRDMKKAVLQTNGFIKIFGVVATVDIFYTFEGIFGYYEVNLWNIFFAQIDLTIKYKTSESLLYDVSGRFVAKERKKRQTQTKLDFTTTYMNALKKIVNRLAKEVNDRITSVQKAVTDGQNEVTNAQNSFKKQKNIFSNKEAFMNKTKSNVEKAIGIVEKLRAPYQLALEKLKKAQIIVDNLCKIRKCNSVCIPGLRCKICSKKVWLARVYYPCCDWSRCMFRIKDPICIVKNIACKVIRSFAFAALEGAKIVVKVSMIPYDIAEITLNAAELIADKAHWAFKIAANVFDIANVVLDVAKIFLEQAKKVLEAVKSIVSKTANVLNKVIEHGLKKIVDVRDCTFHVQITTKDLPIFDVRCEINLLQKGWKTYSFLINFLHPYVSMYHAAKAVLNDGIDVLNNSDRKKRDTFILKSKIYTHLRQSRDTYHDIVNLNNTLRFDSDPPTNYEYRKAVFALKCKEIQNIEEFMQNSFIHLLIIANDSNNIYKIREEFEAEISIIEIGNITEDLSFENLNVSREYARQDYNLTDDEINLAEEQSRNEIMNSSVLNNFMEIINRSRNNTDAELNNVDSINFLSYWLTNMNNATEEYFDPGVCSGFQDCLLHCLSVLFNLFAEEELPNIKMIQDVITHLDENVTSLFSSQNVSIKELVSIMQYFNSTITGIIHLNPFCSIAPTFRFDLHNITAVAGSSVVFSCDAVGDPQPDIWWFKEGNVIADEQSANLFISNIGPKDEAVYHCVIGNVVANLSSNEAWLHVVENKDIDTANDTLDTFIFITIGVAVMVFMCIAFMCFIYRRTKHARYDLTYHKGDDFGKVKTAKGSENRLCH